MGGWPPFQSHTTQSLTPPDSTQTSTPWPRQLSPQQAQVPLCRVAGSLEGRVVSFPEPEAKWRGVPHPRKMASAVWETDSAQGSLQLSLQSHKPQAVLTQLYSPLPSFCWSPGSVAVNKFLCIGFLRDTYVSGRLLSLPGRQNLLFPQPDIMWAPLPGSVLWAGEPSLGLWPHTSQGEPLQLRYPSRISATPFHCVASSVNPCL